MIEQHFEHMEVGEVDCLNGKLDGVDVKVIAMKEPDYVMSLMTTYGTLEPIEGATTRRDYKNNNGEMVRKTFNYTEIIYNHYHYRHAVDDHNNKRHSPISLEAIWATHWWPNRVFSFLLAVTEVNIKLTMEYFMGVDKVSMLVFRRNFAEALINNKDLHNQVDCSPNRELRPRSCHHQLLTVDSFKRWNGVKFVRAKTQFPQRKCTGCGRKVRTYCSCNPNNGLCNLCYTNHVVEIETVVEIDD
jgi:Transposase IS4